MQIERTAIDGVLILRPRKIADARGYFAAVANEAELRKAGIVHDWMQDNQSLSSRKGTVRGLHFQRAPHAQAKIIRVIRGAALDVCVDLRDDSPTFGRHVAVELSSENMAQVYVPEGFAHGFCTLSEDTEVLYRVSSDWAPSHEAGLMWNDPALGIDWPVKAEDAVLADRDRTWPDLASLKHQARS